MARSPTPWKPSLWFTTSERSGGLLARRRTVIVLWRLNFAALLLLCWHDSCYAPTHTRARTCDLYWSRRSSPEIRILTGNAVSCGAWDRRSRLLEPEEACSEGIHPLFQASGDPTITEAPALPGLRGGPTGPAGAGSGSD